MVADYVLFKFVIDECVRYLNLFLEWPTFYMASGVAEVYTVLDSIPRWSKKYCWVFLWNSQWQFEIRICARLMAIGSPPIIWDLN